MSKLKTQESNHSESKLERTENMIQKIIEKNPKLLAECAIAERLRRIDDVELDPLLFNTPLIYQKGRALEAMTSIYAEYIETANEAKLPILMSAPTWRLDHQRIKAAGQPSTINTDAVHYMLNLRSEYENRSQILVGALVGPKNDCYKPEMALNERASQEFHSAQINELANTEVDYLHAQTMPSVKEAIGISRLMAATGKPYIISFCLSPNGNILDGTKLTEAFDEFDDDTLFYVNCTHPKFLLENYEIGELDRLVGIQANGSSKNVTLLDGSDISIADSVTSWADSMLELHQLHGVKILGGCCGTTTEHLRALV